MCEFKCWKQTIFYKFATNFTKVAITEKINNLIKYFGQFLSIKTQLLIKNLNHPPLPPSPSNNKLQLSF
jgi:hypothetical protein